MSPTDNQESTKNAVQTLIVPENEEAQYIELGLKCITPGIPRERFDKETQKEVEIIVQQQALQIKNRAATEPSQVSSHEEKENLESISEEPIQEENPTPHDLSQKINTETNGILKRARIPPALDLNNQPDFFTKKLKTSEGSAPTTTNPNVSIKYVGYNETPQYSQSAKLPQGQYYNHPGYYPPEYAMMQQQYMMQQMNYMNQNSYQQQSYPQGETAMNGYPTYITPLTNSLPYGNPVQNQHIQPQQPELPQRGLGQRQEGPKPILEPKEKPEEKSEEKLEENPEKEEKQKEEEEKEDIEYKGVISINKDSFNFEFKTKNEETVGKLQTEINDLNREKFLKICEKTWNESYWLMKKREQFSNPTPSGLSADIEVSQEKEQEDEKKDKEGESPESENLDGKDKA